jgi:hypothetical protein
MCSQISEFSELLSIIRVFFLGYKDHKTKRKETWEKFLCETGPLFSRVVHSTILLPHH